MIKLIEKYINKLFSQGLAEKDDPLLISLDAELYYNRPIEQPELIRLFDLMNINTILFSKPAEPYRSIIDLLTRGDVNRITPLDCETRTFFHEIPVIDEITAKAISAALSKRRSAIIRNKGIVTYGTVSPEQAFVSFSSTCFSTFVKYFYDSLLYFESCKSKGSLPDERYLNDFKRIIQLLQPLPQPRPLTYMRPETEEDVIMMLSEAGKAMVESQLVDSSFGNISYVFGNNIYISQTGSSLDELEYCIDAVPLNGSSTIGITASSELSTHKNIFYATRDKAILHGHPRFSVIMSMHCEIKDCLHYRDIDYCYRMCRQKRYVMDIPVVSGEIGTGPTGLVNTVPEAMREGKGAIVFGHGVFTSGKDNFQDPFQRMSDIEVRCRSAYLEAIEKLGIVV